MILSIRDWQLHFEVNRTREMKYMRWIPVPNKFDGDGYTVLLDHRHGVAHFGIWILLLEVASKCSPRGLLVRDTGEPHTPISLSRMTRAGVATIEAAIPRLLEIGWLEDKSPKTPANTLIPQEGAEIPQEGAASRAPEHGTERNGTERNIYCSEPAEPDSKPEADEVLLTIPLVKRDGVYPVTQSYVNELSEIYPGDEDDLLRELKKCRQWSVDNQDRRKTLKGIRRHITGWFDRAQNRRAFAPASEKEDIYH